MQKGVVYMGCIITVASGKGGVGKTTVSANLACAISDKGFSVAVIDMDLGLSSLDLALDVCGQGGVHVTVLVNSRIRKVERQKLIL